MGGGACWAAVHGVAKSRTGLNDFTFMHWRRKWQPTPVFLRGESQDGGAWWATVYGVAQSQTQLKRLSSKYFIQGEITVYLNFLLLNIITKINVLSSRIRISWVSQVAQ